ncbi:MAG: hypothetical protein Q7R74_00130 [bacterium]|nr:hypothetical protein [bacterium]
MRPTHAADRAGGNRAESVPKLTLDPVTDARTVGEAMKRTAAKGAGEADLQAMQTWLNDPKNINSPIADEWKQTINFFPNAAGGKGVLYLRWDGDGFRRHSHRLDRVWVSGCRAVLRS